MNYASYAPTGYQHHQRPYGAPFGFRRPGGMYGLHGMAGSRLRSGGGLGNRYSPAAMRSSIASPYALGGAFGNRLNSQLPRTGYISARPGGMSHGFGTYGSGRSYPHGGLSGYPRYSPYARGSYRSPLSGGRRPYAPFSRSGGCYSSQQPYRRTSSYPSMEPRYGTGLGAPYPRHGLSSALRSYPSRPNHLRRHSYPSAYDDLADSDAEQDLSDNDPDDYDVGGDSDDDDDDLYSKYKKKRPYKPSYHSPHYGYGTDYDGYDDDNGLDHSCCSGYGRPNHYRYNSY